MLAGSKGLTFEMHENDTRCLVSLEGDLNMFSAPELRINLIKKLDAGVRKFIVDLTQVSFVDSSGIGVLVSFVSLARKTDGTKVVLCGLNSQIRNIFEVTRLLSVFNVVDDLAAAESAILA